MRMFLYNAINITFLHSMFKLLGYIGGLYVMSILKVLYLPYAGGSAQLCSAWKRYLGDEFVMIPIELAGRGSRFKDAFYTDIDEALNDLIDVIKVAVDNEPYVIMGHSFGALLVYELYYKLQEANYRLPEHLFFSGSLPPNRRRFEDKIYNLSDIEFINEIMRFNGMEREVLDNKDLMQIVLPILRADFNLLDMYEFREKSNKITKNVTVMYGNDMTYNGVQAWSELSENKVDFYHIDGDHFFIKKNTQEVLRIVKRQLYELLQTI